MESFPTYHIIYRCKIFDKIIITQVSDRSKNNTYVRQNGEILLYIYRIAFHGFNIEFIDLK